MSDSDESKKPASATLQAAMEAVSKQLGSEARSPSAKQAHRKARPEQSGAELAKLEKAADETALPLPPGVLSKKQAMDWAEEQLDLHTPLAAQVVIARLKNGTRDERFATAKELLKGRGLYGEAQGGRVGLGPILVITGLDPQHLPWGGIVKGKPVKTVDGSVVGAMAPNGEDGPGALVPLGSTDRLLAGREAVAPSPGGDGDEVVRRLGEHED